MAENPRIEELRRRVQADPASIAFAALAEEYRRLGRFEEAVATCHAGLQRHPAYLSARVTLGRALVETGDYDGARAQFETVLQSAPENIAAIRGLAQIHERVGHSAEMDPYLAQLMRDHIDTLPPPKPAATRVEKPAPQAEPVSLISNPEPEESIDHLLSPLTAVQDTDPDTLDLPDFPDLPDLPDIPERPQAARVAEIGAVHNPAAIARLARLERFLAAIQHARHA